MEVDKAFSTLKELHKIFFTELFKIRTRYLDRHLNDVFLNTYEWDHDSQSCIILIHAAVENYIEVLANILIESAFYEYKTKDIVNDILLKFCWINMDQSPKFDEKTWDDDRQQFIKDLEDNIKKFTAFLSSKNHGIKIKNLNAILRPVSLDLSRYNLNSLTELAELRGASAHRFLNKGLGLKRIQQAENPEKIDKIIFETSKIVNMLHYQSIKKLNISDEKKKKYFIEFIINYLNIRKQTLQSKEVSESLFNKL